VKSGSGHNNYEVVPAGSSHEFNERKVNPVRDLTGQRNEMTESYKKWIILGIAAIAAVIFLVVAFQPDYEKETTVAGTPSESPGLSGPIIDVNPDRVVPLEEMGVDTKDPEALSLLGDKYFETKRYAQAIELYKKVLELRPDDADTYNDLGLAYQYTGNSDLAIETLKKGTEVMPSLQRIWLSLGFVYMSSGNTDDAKSTLKKAVDMDPATEVGKEAERMLGLLK
jgi:tetratricopeptide (TPR) repeat protein